MNVLKVLLYQVFVLIVIIEEMNSEIEITKDDSEDSNEASAIPVTTETSTSKPSDPLATFRDECFACHNTRRSWHGSPNLTRNEGLEQLAQTWAYKLLEMRQLKRSGNEQYGENGAYKYVSPKRRITGEEICQQWYAEIDNYDFDDPGHSKSGGKITHFSQVVWADTEEIGIGMADDGEGTLFAVAIYNPPGNYKKKFAENVKPRTNTTTHSTTHSTTHPKID